MPISDAQRRGIRAYQKRWPAKHYLWKWGNRIRKYDITVDQYKMLLERQNGVCAICGLPPKTRRLAVDHDHITKRVRGLLCFRCNRSIVGQQRNGTLLRLAADYLDSTFDGRRI